MLAHNSMNNTMLSSVVYTTLTDCYNVSWSQVIIPEYLMIVPRERDVFEHWSLFRWKYEVSRALKHEGNINNGQNHSEEHQRHEQDERDQNAVAREFAARYFGRR